MRRVPLTVHERHVAARFARRWPRASGHLWADPEKVTRADELRAADRVAVMLRKMPEFAIFG